MINYELPTSVTVGEEEYEITRKGDYRVILDILCALVDRELDERSRIIVALILFYGENVPDDTQAAVAAMMAFINLEQREREEEHKPPLMDWEQDFPLMIAPINKVLGQEVRSLPYLHWWTFLAGYNEIDGECLFSTVVKIRRKRQNGEKLDKGEQRFYAENRDIIDLKRALSEEDEAFLRGED